MTTPAPKRRVAKAAAVPGMTERDLLKSVMETARDCGWLVHHETFSVYSPAGLPDLIMVKPPRIIYMELKSDVGKVSDKQRLWLSTLNRCPGVEVYIGRPANLEAIYRVLLGVPTLEIAHSLTWEVRGELQL